MDQAAAMRQLNLPLNRDLFLRTLIRELAGTLEEVVGYEEAAGLHQPGRPAHGGLDQRPLYQGDGGGHAQPPAGGGGSRGSETADPRQLFPRGAGQRKDRPAQHLLPL